MRECEKETRTSAAFRGAAAGAEHASCDFARRARTPIAHEEIVLGGCVVVSSHLRNNRVNLGVRLASGAEVPRTQRWATSGILDDWIVRLLGLAVV